ncbi:hypothetical protein H0H93_002854 [Arthromyces matolae]|nr:hypothetical protein H0H93_002854 [Arthromyces matolae]
MQPPYAQASSILYLLFISILVCATPVHPRNANSVALGQRSFASAHTFQSLHARGPPSNGSVKSFLSGLVRRPKDRNHIHGSTGTTHSPPARSHATPRTFEQLVQDQANIEGDIKELTAQALATSHQTNIDTHSGSSDDESDWGSVGEVKYDVQFEIMECWVTLLDIAKEAMTHYPQRISEMVAGIKDTVKGAEQWHKDALRNEWSVCDLKIFKEMPQDLEKLKAMMEKLGHAINSV